MGQNENNTKGMERRSDTGHSGLYLTSGISGIMSGVSTRDRLIKSPRLTLLAEAWQIYDGVFSLDCNSSAMQRRKKTGT